MSALESIHSFYPAQILYRNLAEEVKETEIDSVAVSIRREVGWIVGFTTLAGKQLRLYCSHFTYVSCL